MKRRIQPSWFTLSNIQMSPEWVAHHRALENIAILLRLPYNLHIGGQGVAQL